jgi:L-alanine-DL-glutamate epimerase-like enolase superfamily enzyme
MKSHAGRVEACAYLLSFPVDFKIARTRIIYSHHVVVTLATGGLVGCGSGVLYRGTPWQVKQIWDEWLHAALAALEVAALDENWQPLLARMGNVQPGLTFAVDSALWDLRGKQRGQRVADLLGGAHRTQIPITEQIFIDRWAESETELRAIQQRGTTSVKVKTGFHPVQDIALVKRVQHFMGPGVEVRVDANRGYALTDSLDSYRAMHAAGVLAAEEPIGDKDWTALCRFRQETGLPVMLDESILSLDDLRQAIDAEALDILNVKLTRVGGISRALDYVSLCQQAGVAISIGCAEDIGPGMASILQLSAALPALYSTEGMGYLRLGADIVTTPLPVVGGRVALPDAPGLGVELLPDLARAVGTHARMLDLTASSRGYVNAYSRYVLWRQRAATALHRLARMGAAK